MWASPPDQAGNRDLTFDVDSKTIVQPPPPSASKPPRAGQPIGSGVKLTSVIQSGQSVLVAFREVNGRNLATEISVNVAVGTVKSVSDSRLVLVSDGKNVTFAVGRETAIVGNNGSPMSGGSTSMTNSVRAGDTATVSYTSSVGAMRAVEIRVTAKGRSPM